MELNYIKKLPEFKLMSAISVGIVQGRLMLDLNYGEDSKADVDMNVIMDVNKNLVEIQGTAEGKNFSRVELNQLLDLAEKGTTELNQKIKSILNIKSDLTK